jgi:hypothetical protein
MIGEGWFDIEFVRQWTNGPFLVRESDGRLLRADMLAEGDDGGYVAWDEGRGMVLRYDPAARAYDQPPVRLALSGSFVIGGREGRSLAGRPSISIRRNAARSRRRSRHGCPASAPKRSASRRDCCGSIAR